MRYRGGGAGHEGLRDAVDRFLGDRDEIDNECRQEYIKRTLAKKADGEVWDADEDSVNPNDDAEILQDEDDRNAWNKLGNLRDFGEDEEDFGYRRRTSDDTYMPSSARGSDGGDADDEEMDTEDELGALGLPEY